MKRKYTKIFIKKNWADEWQVSSAIEPLAADAACLPTIGTAKFLWRLGQGKWEDNTPMHAVDEYSSFWPWYYIQIQVADNAEFDNAKVYWTGYVPVSQFNILGANPVKAADVEIMAYEISKILETPLKESFCLPVGETTPITIEGVLKFNKRYAFEGRIIGNRSTAKYDATDGSDYESYIFSNDGEVWTNADILEYLIAWHQPMNAPQFRLNWMKTHYPEIWSALDEIKCVYDFEGYSLLEAINTLIPRNRGLCWRAEYAGGDGEEYIEIIASSLLDEDFKIYTTTLPANKDKLGATVWGILGLQGLGADRQVKATIDSRGQFDKITVRGAKMKTCFTASLDNALEKAWTDTLETAYKDAAKNISGYSSLSEDEQKVWNDRYRGTDRFRRVYSSFRIKPSFTWLFGSEKIMPAINPQTGELDTNTNAAFWPVGKKILDYLPFKVGIDYSDNETDENPENSEPEYRRIFAIVKKTDGTGCPAEKLASATGTISATVRVMQKEMGVEIKFSPAYLAAKNHFDSAEPGLHDIEDEDTIACDYEDHKVTMFIETDQYVKLEHLIVASASKVKNEIVIEVPSAELWYVVPGTTVDIDADGSELIYSGTTNIVRDDRELLKAIMTAAAAWYGQEQYQVSISSDWICDTAWLGDMLTDIDVTGANTEIGATVTHIGWDFRNQTTVIETDFCELNLAAIATGRRKVAGEKMPEQMLTKKINTLTEEVEKLKEQVSTVPQRFEIPPASGGVASIAINYATVIVAPTFQNPYAAQGTTEYAGSGDYILRQTDPAGGTWTANHDPAYAVGTQVIDSVDNRVYTRIAPVPPAEYNPALAPHENALDWLVSEEIKIEYASCQYNRITETGLAIKDCWPVFAVGVPVKYTSFVKQDTTTIYLLDETVTYVNTPELRNLIMHNGAGMAGYQ